MAAALRHLVHGRRIKVAHPALGDAAPLDVHHDASQLAKVDATQLSETDLAAAPERFQISPGDACCDFLRSVNLLLQLLVYGRRHFAAAAPTAAQPTRSRRR